MERARSLRTTQQSARPYNTGWGCARRSEFHLQGSVVDKQGEGGEGEGGWREGGGEGGRGRRVGDGGGGGGGGDEAPIEMRIGRERAAYLQMKSIWASPNLIIKIKIKIFNTTVELKDGEARLRH